MSAEPFDLAVAAAIRALGLGRPDVAALNGGIVNRSYRLRAPGADLVLKIAGGPSTALFANPRSEFEMQSLAARNGLAPPIVLADPARGFLVSEHAAGRVLSAQDFGDHRQLRRVGAWIAALHALPVPPGLAVVDFGERAAAYLHRVVAHGTDALAAELSRELDRRRAALPGPDRLAACHHDLHRRNFVDDGVRLLAVDWEYAGPGDPASDLAACVGYQALGDAAVDALLGGYGAADPALRERIAALGWIFDCLCYAWIAAAEIEGVTPDAAERSRLAARLAH